MNWLSFLSVLAVSTVVAAYPNPGTVTGDTGIADPTMCKSSSGTYFVFGTGVGIPILTSTDRTAWVSGGTVFPSGSSWASAYTGSSDGSLWAPDCTVVGSTFYLYYAASTFGSQNSAIFFAKSSTGLSGSWTNEGLVTSSSSSVTYNTIDPNLLIVGSAWYLSFGSFWTGIKGATLSSSTGKLASSTLTSLAERTADGGALEASVIYESGSYYYLFTSWDTCCDGTASTYNIRVGRATSPLGPYVDEAGVALTAGGGTEILGTHGTIYGPGGQDVMTDGDDVVLVYHYYESTGSYLGINLLDFSTGWPVVY